MLIIGIGCIESKSKATTPQTQVAPSASSVATVTPTVTPIETKAYEDQQWLNVHVQRPSAVNLI